MRPTRHKVRHCVVNIVGADTMTDTTDKDVEIEKLREEVLRQRKVIEFWVAEVKRLGGSLEDDGK